MRASERERAAAAAAAAEAARCTRALATTLLRAEDAAQVRERVVMQCVPRAVQSLSSICYTLLRVKTRLLL